MTASLRHRPPVSVAIASAAALPCLAVFPSLDLRAQTTAPQTTAGRRFAVVSIRPNTWTPEEMGRAMVSAAQKGDPAPVGIRTYPGGRLTGTRVVLRALVMRAFGLKANELRGGRSRRTRANSLLSCSSCRRSLRGTRVIDHEGPLRGQSLRRPVARPGPPWSRPGQAWCRRGPRRPAPPLRPFPKDRSRLRDMKEGIVAWR